VKKILYVFIKILSIILLIPSFLVGIPGFLLTLLADEISPDEWTVENELFKFFENEK
jgi:hypothetical protein